MSFLNDIVSLGKTAYGFISGNSVGSQIARTALTGFALSKLANSVNKENNIGQQDRGRTIQIDPDTEYKVPVLYGSAVLSGAITDAVLANGNTTMWYCITLCERTGDTVLGTGPASSFTFQDIYWNNNRLIFQSDGITASGYIDSSGQTCSEINGLIKVYCFGGSSTVPTVPELYTNNSLLNANQIFPNWGANHTMSDLVFALVRIDYSAKNNVTGVGEFKFKIKNSMDQPGDCLYDYLTNTRYGAGIDPSEIYSS